MTTHTFRGLINEKSGEKFEVDTFTIEGKDYDFNERDMLSEILSRPEDYGLQIGPDMIQWQGSMVLAKDFRSISVELLSKGR